MLHTDSILMRADVDANAELLDRGCGTKERGARLASRESPRLVESSDCVRLSGAHRQLAISHLPRSLALTGNTLELE